MPRRRDARRLPLSTSDLSRVPIDSRTHGSRTVTRVYRRSPRRRFVSARVARRAPPPPSPPSPRAHPTQTHAKRDVHPRASLASIDARDRPTRASRVSRIRIESTVPVASSHTARPSARGRARARASPIARSRAFARPSPPRARSLARRARARRRSVPTSRGRRRGLGLSFHESALVTRVRTR